jgi:hypothetical protein
MRRKEGMAFFTHGGKPGQTNEIFRKWIESRGMNLVSVTSINQKYIQMRKKP